MAHSTNAERNLTPDHAPPAASDLARAADVIGRTEREHATLRTLLDQVERALEGTKSVAADVALARLRSAVWDLRLTFEAHLDFEEAELAPLWRGGDSAKVSAAVAMILEHNEQRRMLYELVDDLESDVLEREAVGARTTALVVALRRDIAAEDRVLLRMRAPEPPG